ncbi:MAG: hypothetical protein IDH49_14590 [Gammaproteobacteria bacterium]|nr:hypothetical protein [Gammaproteobacteria bacterium]
MFKNVFVVLVFFLATISGEAVARTDCPVARVLHVQIEGKWVLYSQEGAPWRTLGDITQTGTKERLGAMLAAQMTGRPVMVAYESDIYNCNVTDFSGHAFIVRTY